MTLELPLRISRDRVLLYGAVLAAIVSLPFLIFPSWFHDVAFRGDFANFWSAGANAGSAALLDPSALFAWQRAHGITPQVFVYPPGFAWFYAPLSRLTPMQAMIVVDAAMAAAVGLAAAVAAALYGFRWWFALVAAFAWGPCVNALQLGQNTPLALLFSVWAGWALVTRRPLSAGLAVGLLLYKPSIAIPFVVLLLARKQWRAVAVVGLCAAAWYFVSVLATHGDWSWPAAYARLVFGSNAGEFAGNAHKTYTLPTLLQAFGLPRPWCIMAGLALFLAAIPLLIRVSTIEAVSMTPLVGLAASIHSWPYEATLLLPAVWFAMIRLSEPWRTRIVVGAYLVAALALAVPYGGHALAILCVGGALWWICDGYAAGRMVHAT